MTLDAASCYRALCARDARFDGVFFVAVKTTGVYCRPICPARTPLRERCEFFSSWVEAERAGYRACLRCRPELAPGHAKVDALSRLSGRAVERIEAGALERGSLSDLATELGVSARHLRRALAEELGTSARELERSRRLLLAKRLLQDSTLPITAVAFASGFRSLRRFNAELRAHSGHAPSALRKRRPPSTSSRTFCLRLDYRPPLAWDALLEFLSVRAIAGVEHVVGDCYVRTVQLAGVQGIVRVRPAARASREGRLQAELSLSLVPVLPVLVARLRRLFDLDAHPRRIDELFASDPRLRRSVARTPGLRVPGAFDGFEVLLRAIVGQQVSVAAATTLAGRLAAALGEPLDEPAGELTRCTPTAERIARATPEQLSALGILSSRAHALRTAAQAVTSGAIRLEPSYDVQATQATLAALQALPGIGPWTASYVAMRALGDPDALLDGDLVLQRALGGLRAAELRTAADAWRPFRAYAVMHLWRQPSAAPQRKSAARPRVDKSAHSQARSLA